MPTVTDYVYSNEIITHLGNIDNALKAVSIFIGIIAVIVISTFVMEEFRR